MKTVGIIGLGLIGGSMAKAVRKSGEFTVLGTDANENVVKQAIREDVLKDELSKDNIREVDLLIVALYPMDVADVILDYAEYMKKGAIIVDCTGVKGIICEALSQKLSGKGIHFVGGHPMAGKEVSGYSNSEGEMFGNASMILCRDEYTDEEAFQTACAFFKKIGFFRIKETTPQEHDRVIAYTSQMAHVVSNAYIKSPTLDKRYGFSAGSFKDMTRVALLNENMWADLFLANKDALVSEIDIFSEHLKEYRDALEREDRQELVSLLGKGRELKECDEKQEKNEN